MTENANRLALGLTTDAARRLLDYPYLIRKAAEAGLAFVAVGVERGRSRGDGGAHVYDPLLLASYLHQIEPALLVLPYTAPARNAPWNLARTILSNDHLSRGNGGVLLGRADAYADEAVRAVDHDADPADPFRAPVSTAALAEYVGVLRDLWQTWPSESIVLDRGAGVYARREHVRQVPAADRTPGTAGPLPLPTSLQGEPVVGAWVNGFDELLPALATADLVVLAEDPGLQDEVRRSVPRQFAGQIFAHTTLRDPEGLRSLAGNALIEPALGGEGAPSALDRLLRELREVPFARTANIVTAREKLALARPHYRLVGAPPAFETAGGRA